MNHRAGDRRQDPRTATAETPCGRCTCRYPTVGALETHLLREHLMSATQAHAEAVEAATGGSVDPDTGRCRGCHRLIEDPHTSGCNYARTRGLPTAPIAPARTPERAFLLRWQAHLPAAQQETFFADLAVLITHVQQRERRRLCTDEAYFRLALDEMAAEIALQGRGRERR